MRLFRGMFVPLAAQALLAAVVPGCLLVWNLHAGQQAELVQRDKERLALFAMTATEVARAGRPLASLLPAPESLADRVQLATPQGRAIAGPAGTALAEQPIRLDGRTVALARIVREPTLTAAERRILATQYIGIGVVVLALFAALLVAAYRFARAWSAPQIELYRLSREVIHGDHGFEVEEVGPEETVATMRNVRRIASQFDRLETARRTWLVSVAEELKRPAEELRLHIAVLAQETPPIDAELLDALAADRKRFTQLGEDLRAIALADLGRLPVDFAQVDPRALIHNAIWSNRRRAEAAGVHLETSTLPEYTILVRWDGARIEQLFGALIENSLRYTPKHGRIVLGLESSREAWRLIIDDSAPGVDVMLAQRLFEPFYRSSERAEESGASGLGLATARAIVEAHHGRIEASRSPIGGLRVTVVLPAEPPRA